MPKWIWVRPKKTHQAEKKHRAWISVDGSKRKQWITVGGAKKSWIAKCPKTQKTVVGDDTLMMMKFSLLLFCLWCSMCFSGL